MCGAHSSPLLCAATGRGVRLCQTALCIHDGAFGDEPQLKLMNPDEVIHDLNNGRIYVQRRTSWERVCKYMNKFADLVPECVDLAINMRDSEDGDQWHKWQKFLNPSNRFPHCDERVYFSRTIGAVKDLMPYVAKYTRKGA